ncbi:MAG: 5'/3'-nucleotidase SurE [Eubacteriales bacterium]|nr:5'/3'-nucleotidase SurE [Eubacteriales bacterium]
MRLLVTNDDGVDAPGILTLAKTAAAAGHEVLVSAPATQQSAAGHRLTIIQSLMVRERHLDAAFSAYAVEGSPVDCVRIGRRLSDKPFDFCLSGINDGENVGTALFYSGTAAAAREAAMLNLPSMAISIGVGADEDMRVHLAEQALVIMEYILRRPMPRLTFCNLNGPALHRGEVRPAKIAPISEAYFLDDYEERVNPRGIKYFWLEEGVRYEKPEPGSDLALLMEGHMTVSFVGGFRNHNDLYRPML